MDNGCKQRPNVQESTNVLELATFAYPARRENCFSHDGLTRARLYKFDHLAFWNTVARQIDVRAKSHQGLFIVATVNLGLVFSFQGHSVDCAACIPGKKHNDFRPNFLIP